MLKIITSILFVFLLYLALSVGCFLMLRLILGYTEFRDDVQFLLYKQEYIHNPIWKAAFYIHVFTAIICLILGFTQFSKDFLKENRELHRLFGKIYAYNIFFVNVPTGMILAIYANGELIGRIAFVLLDILWFWFTYKAVASAKAKNFKSHKQYMIRSYALTLSAITLRSWNWIISSQFVIDPLTQYQITAWSFIVNLLVAEIIISYKVSNHHSPHD